ncbi:porin [Cellvibrio japonicus]|uniref:Putative porin n=1 Tax=Cellvibrio japonicus (strain Ueda107) TaxID=498211 RepID=B3PJR3_CELJU|nr:porin [Cellvibrio japonicus]ACE85922.1 putative porin [Cellvibrio japonicus Ueda107]QEI12700.1 porin [Cellvibrio japonicus]QEI16274.1 porin [Cellvibrio japonicus]QEI19852.1 porin [Cellvibrio japonicus]
MSSNLLSRSNGSLGNQHSFARKTLPATIGIVLSLLAAHQASANTAGLNFYGRANVSADFLDNGTDSDLNVSSNSSRIGVRASTDIAEGLKGLLQVETQINYDNGSGNLANRDTFIGLEGGFGRVRLGQIDTPLKQIRSAVDFFGDQIGDLRNVTRLNGSTGAPYTSQDFDARFRNGVYYNTPAFGGGFVFNLHYTPQVNEGANLEEDTAAYSTSLTYEAGNLYFSVATEQWETTNDSNALRVGARYKFTNLTLSGLFQQATIKNQALEEDVQTFGIGASYKLSSTWVAKGQIYTLDPKDRDDSGTTLAVVGADYILSNQFRLLFAYAQADNDELARYRITGGGGYGDAVATTVGETASGFSLGLRYDF